MPRTLRDRHDGERPGTQGKVESMNRSNGRGQGKTGMEWNGMVGLHGLEPWTNRL
jgi:hypothetical protein